MKLTPSGIILLGALALCLAGKGQMPIGGTKGSILVAKGDGSPAYYVNPDTTTNVMLEIVLKRRGSYHFFREGYKRGNEYWIIDGQRVKKLPKGWFVWDFRVINKP